MNIKKNIVIEKLDHFGRGIYKEDYNIYFIDNTIPGDIVDVEIYKEKKNIKECRVINYRKRSNNYIDSKCKYSNLCGGCNLINLSYEEQLKYKEEKIKELINKMLKEDIKVNSIIPSKNIYNYRNKIILHGLNNTIGLYKNNTHELIEVNECLLVPPEINKVINDIREYIKEKDVVISDITIKRTTTGEILLSIYGENIDYDDFYKEFRNIKVILINNQLITKDKYIEEELLGKRFNISNHSFFQVNSETVKDLYGQVINYIKNNNYKKALDLYCGTGTIGILISDYVDHVLGIEEVEDAVNDAEKNKLLNNINNIEFIKGKVEDNLDKISNYDLIIVDPPRAGLDINARKNILRINAKSIIYVSCDPATLMRDLNDLKVNYEIKEITPVDMFPNTYHCESITVLERR